MSNVKRAMARPHNRTIWQRRTITSLVLFLVAAAAFVATDFLSGCEGHVTTFDEIGLQRLVKFDGITYRMGHVSPYANDDLTEYDTVRSFVPDAMHDPRYRLKNGESSLLEKGTPVYAIKGYSPDFRLVAKPWI